MNELEDDLGDEKVLIPIDISAKDLLFLMTQAHERDVTFNQYVEQIVLELIESKENASE